MLRPLFHRLAAPALLSMVLSLSSLPLWATNWPQSLPFSQDWADSSLISVANSWTNVPGITGYSGNDLPGTSAGAHVNPLFLLDGSISSQHVIPGPFTHSDNSLSGVGEFSSLQGSGRMVGLRGSASADAPFLLINLNTTDQSNIRIRYTVHDKDSSARNVISSVALQYRIGTSGDFTNIANAYIYDATDPNAATKSTDVEVMLPADAEDEPHVQLRIITTNYIFASGALISDAEDEWIGIDDIEIGPLPVLSIENSDAIEGDVVGCPVPMNFTVSSDQPADGDLVFSYTISPVSAQASSDYQPLPFVYGGGTITAGDSSTLITVPIVCDEESEPNEIFTVTLQPLELSHTVDNIDYLATGTIIDDDRPELSVSDASASEGTGCGSTVMEFTVSLDAPASTNIPFTYVAYGNGSASPFSDFTPVTIPPGNGTILAGEKDNSVQVPVEIFCDGDPEPNETFVVQLTANAGSLYDLGDDFATGTILNDDGPTVSIADAALAEGDLGEESNLTFTVQLSQTATAPVSFSIQAVAWPAPLDPGEAMPNNDFVFSAPAPIVIPAGKAAASFNVPIIGDGTMEPDETFQVVITNVLNANVVDSDLTATGTILNDEGPTISIADVALAEGDSEDTTFTFTVQLSEAPEAAAPVSFSIQARARPAPLTDGEADPASDFNISEPIKVEFLAGLGSTSFNFDVLVPGDSNLEPNETFEVVITDVLNANTPGSDLVAIGTIIDDDHPHFTIQNNSMLEGTAGCTNGYTQMEFLVISDMAVPALTEFRYVTLSGGTATADIDYASRNLDNLGNGRMMPGDYIATITIPVVCDSNPEPNETFNVALLDGDNYNLDPVTEGVATGIILDDDTPVLTIEGQEIFEGSSPVCTGGTTPMTFIVNSTLDAPVGGLRFYYSVDEGSATLSEFDFVEPDDLFVDMGSEQKTAEITIDVTCDNIFETDETFTVNLTPDTINPIPAYALGVASSATGTIWNDDPVPAVTISSNVAMEGSDLVHTVTLSGATAIQTDYAFILEASGPNPATPDDDFGAPTFSPGVTFNGTQITVPADVGQFTVTIPTVQDTFDENDETLSLTIGGVSATGTITDDGDAPTALTFSISDASLEEGDDGDTTNMVFTVSLDQPVPDNYNEVLVDYATANDIAEAGSDFINSSGTLTFYEGDISQQVVVQIVGDTDDTEGDETFFVNLSNPQGANVSIATEQAIGTITDDDAGGVTETTISISALTSEVFESNGNPARLSFEVSATFPTPAPSGTFSVDVAAIAPTLTSDAIPGEDFVDMPQTVVLSPGHASQIVTVDVLDDSDPEPTETLTLELLNPASSTGANVVLGTVTASALILDDESVTGPTLVISDAEPVYEGNGNPTDRARFTVSLLWPTGSPPAGPVTVDVNSMIGTADANDFTAIAQQVVLSTDNPHEVIEVEIAADLVDEDTEDFTLELSNENGAVIGDGIGLGIILDNIVSVPTFIVSNGNDTKEGAASNFTVSLLLPPGEGGTHSVMVSSESGTGAHPALEVDDFAVVAELITLTDGDPSRIIPVNTVDDTIGEATEGFTLQLSDQSDGAVIGDRSGDGNILESDGGAPTDPTDPSDTFANGFSDGFE